MKKKYLMTGNKKVMGAVLVAAAMMLGVTACGGNTQENVQPESSAESFVESSMEESIMESTVEESSVEDSAEESEDADMEVQTRTYTLEMDGVETEFVETFFDSEDGYSLWYPAEMLEQTQIDGYDGFLQIGTEGEELASVVIVPVDASMDMKEMLTEVLSGYGEAADVNAGEILEMELDAAAETNVKSLDVIHGEGTDRFYAVSDGENAVLITVKANAEIMEEMSVHFDRMAANIEFGINEDAAF